MSPTPSAVPGTAAKLRPASTQNLIVAEDTSGSFGTIHPSWSVLGRSEAGARERGAGRGQSCCREWGGGDAWGAQHLHRAGQLGLTPESGDNSTWSALGCEVRWVTPIREVAGGDREPPSLS